MLKSAKESACFQNLVHQLNYKKLNHFKTRKQNESKLFLIHFNNGLNGIFIKYDLSFKFIKGEWVYVYQKPAMKT